MTHRQSGASLWRALFQTHTFLFGHHAQKGRTGDGLQVEARQERFAVGDVVATPGAMRALVRALFVMHQSGDWGKLDDEDKQQNLLAIAYGKYIMSSYVLPHTGVRIWVITEGDRSATHVLLPEEYQSPKAWWAK